MTNTTIQKPACSVTIMNSIDIAFQMKKQTNCEMNLPPPPKNTSEQEQHGAVYYSKYNTNTSQQSSLCSTTVASSFSSLSTLDLSDHNQEGSIQISWGSGTLSRSNCVTSNLSALGNVAAETSIPRRSGAYDESGPHEDSWGYFVDTPLEDDR